MVSKSKAIPFTTIQPPAPDDNASMLLVTELNSIPTQERNELFERIHAVEGIVPETQSLIEEKLEALNQALEQIPTKHAYNTALKEDRKYVQSHKFCLQFLRAERFDAMKAARRMVLFFEDKLHRFGKCSLGRPLTIQDLSPAARTLLVRSGVLQTLPVRDRAGRAVLFCFLDASSSNNTDCNALGDASFYLINAACDDEETQRRGTLTVTVTGNIDNVEDGASINMSIANGGLWHPNSSPLRINANHVCPSKQTAISFGVIGNLSMSMGTDFRLLSKIHSTSYVEAINEMKTYGIPVEHLPLSLDGSELRTAFHQKWIRRLSQKEEQLRRNQNFRGIDLPKCQDVCLQRGTTFHLHPGNLAMRALMEPLIVEYHYSASGRRRELNDLVIQAIHDAGGRFLSRSEGGWFEEILDHAEVNKCVGASFRSLLARIRKQPMASSTHKRPLERHPTEPTSVLDTTSCGFGKQQPLESHQSKRRLG